MYEIRHYLTPSGKNLFAEWLDSLRDTKAEARIARELPGWQPATSATVGP